MMINCLSQSYLKKRTSIELLETATVVTAKNKVEDPWVGERVMEKS